MVKFESEYEMKFNELGSQKSVFAEIMEKSNYLFQLYREMRNRHFLCFIFNNFEVQSESEISYVWLHLVFVCIFI